MAAVGAEPACSPPRGAAGSEEEVGWGWCSSAGLWKKPPRWRICAPSPVATAVSGSIRFGEIEEVR